MPIRKPLHERLQNQLDKEIKRELPNVANYKREIDYKRAITLRKSKINRLIIEIYASKTGKSWLDVTEEERKLLRKQNPLNL